MEIHQVSDMLDLFTPNIGMILDDIPHPLFVNIIGPPRMIQIGNRQIHQEAMQWSRVKYASVVDNREMAHSP
jgi:hypothetical protein